MQRKPIEIRTEDFPAIIQPYLSGATLYDSSCSPQARVLYIEKGKGCFLKLSAPGTLEKEALLTEYFHRKGLGAVVLEYICEDNRDYLLTEAVQGEDCTAKEYLDDPKRLCDTLAELLFALHSMDFTDCPVPNHTKNYLDTAERNFAAGRFDLSYCDAPGLDAPQKAYRYIKEHAHLLRNDTLLHGDYCLPNVILKDWKFSGYVDVGNGGVGDRHVDLFWGAWTLRYNLGTDAYRQRFFDAYGRDRIDEERLCLVGACEIFG